VRIRFGPIELGRLPVGRWRALSEDEEAALRAAVGLGGASPGGRDARAHWKAKARGAEPSRGADGRSFKVVAARRAIHSRESESD